jgi:membrane peptidoglycan carboxypeptidase
MSTPIEAHLDLALQIAEAFARSGNVAAARLIADSEARAVAAKVSSLTCIHHNDQQRAACPVCLVTALTTERDELRAALALGQQNCDDAYDDLRAERAAAIARAESAEREAFDWKKIARYETARAERAEREVQRLKSDGAASAFVNMSCRASRAETDRNNLRADKARLDWLEKARPIAWALGSEECGEYWILTDTGEKHPEEAEEFATLRAAIDAAMKEGA